MDVTRSIRTVSDSPRDGKTKTRRLIPKHGTPFGNQARLTLVAVAELRRDRWLAGDELKEAVKCAAARFHLAYDSESVGNAVDIALSRRARNQL